MAIYHENEELIRLGAYKRGADPQIDLAIQLKSQIDSFLQQDKEQVSTFDKTIKSLTELQGKIERTPKKRPSKAKK